MSSKKLFESEVSRSLVTLDCYYYKPIDIMQAGQDKVDYLINWEGRFIAMEVKQVSGLSCPPSDFSGGQKLCLRSNARTRSAVVLVNFQRRPLKHQRGFVLAWILNPLRLDPWPVFNQTGPRDPLALDQQVGEWDLRPIFEQLKG